MKYLVIRYYKQNNERETDERGEMFDAPFSFRRIVPIDRPFTDGTLRTMRYLTSGAVGAKIQGPYVEPFTTR